MEGDHQALEPQTIPGLKGVRVCGVQRDRADHPAAYEERYPESRTHAEGGESCQR